MKVVGFVRSKGNYQGYDFDNFKVHCVYDVDQTSERQGQLTTVVKVPTSIFNSQSVCIGDSVDFIYDRFGKVTGMSVCI